MSKAKRASTTAKITKSDYVAMVAFMVANNCGMIVRIQGKEHGAIVRNGRIVIEGELGEYELTEASVSKYTVRKAWDSQTCMQGLSACYDKWIADASADAKQWHPDASYREWEYSTAWHMHADDMLAYA